MAIPVLSKPPQLTNLEGAGGKLFLVPGLVVSPVATILLLASDWGPWVSSGNLQNSVVGSRGSALILELLLAHVFAILNVAADWFGY